MVVETGTRLGPYEIVSRIGAGGMGEIYKARDTRLNRIVAVKVLPQDLAAHPDRRARFEREARAVAALNHPHICSLFDVGRQGDIEFLVMEYIEGETFSRRLARGALPLDQVLEYAIQIAGALAQAHRLGIFHRDLKPSNIMLTGSGAKLLDFGLAKFQRGEREAQATADLTESGALLGTVAYMAPEQLEGKEADARSDLFAFAAVVYEMAAGRKAFDATSQSGVIAAILDRDPPPLAPTQATQAPTGVSGSADLRLHALDRLLRSCLAKDPQARWQTAHDLVTELRWIAEIDSAPDIPGASPRRRRSLVWGLAGLAAVSGIVLDFVYVHRAKPEQGMLQLSVLAPDKSVFGTAVVSNDGRVAFTASAVGEFKLWVRPLDSLDAQPLSGTEDASYPFWSPDGRFIGFFAVGKLKKIEVGTRSAGLRPGPVQTLCDASNGRGASWNTDGVILFSPTNTGVLYRIPASGGTPEPVTRFDPELQENSHRWPHFLPDGRQFLFFVRSSQPDNIGLYVGALDSQEKARLVGRLSSSVAYAAPGHLLYVRDGTLMAHPFRLESRELAGEPVGIAERIAYDSNSYTDFSVSDNAMLVYRDSAPTDQFAWFDRAGRRSENVGPPGDYGEARLSPDGRRAALHVLDPQIRSGDIWLLELSRGVLTRLTSDPAYEFAPVWSPDGKYVAFSSNRNGPLDLYRKAAAGTGPEEPLLLNPQQKQPTDWSADGRFILFWTREPKTKLDIWILPVTGDRKPLPFLRTEYSERDGQFSPDGKWVAYTSDESGRDEVYVQSFQHDQVGKMQISTHGGSQPKWRPDGTELFYLAPDRKLMVAEMKKRSLFDAAAPRPLFEAPVQTGAAGTGYVYTYAVSGDGNRFFIRTARPEAISRALTVVTNWKAGLRR